MGKMSAMLQTEAAGEGVVASFLEPTVVRSENADAFQQELVACLEEGQGGPVVVDLSKLRYISSMGLGALMALYRAAHQAGREVRLCGVNEQIDEVFAVCQINLLLPIYETRKAALAGK